MGTPGDGMTPGGLAGLRAVRHHEDREAEWLVAVELQFDEGVLLVEVNPDHDDVHVSLTPPEGPIALTYWPDTRCTDVTSTPPYAGLAGSGSTWRWLLRNQQGYTDAFQIELEPEGEPITLQYLGIASVLKVRHVIAVPGAGNPS
jgi:hypothetical protein